MASPFRTFRKNKKVWMAGLVIMAMFAFVVFSNPMISGTRTGGKEPAAITTKFGNLTQLQIANLRGERKLLISFFDLLARLLNSSKSTEAAANAANKASAIHASLGQETADLAIERWVYAKTAESMGLVVDNKSVNDLLNWLLNGVPEPQRVINEVLRATPGGMNPEQFMSIMRKQLLALRLMQLGHARDSWASVTASPGERWDYFKRMHQDASIELAMLPLNKFVKDVKDPSPDELKQFFEKYKNVAPSPNSQEPGFFVPRRVNVQYLAADEAKVESQITEKEITQEYDKDPKKYARDLEGFLKDEKDERDAREKEEAANKPSAEKNEKKAQSDEKKKEPSPKSTAAKPEDQSAAKPADTSARSTGFSRKSEVAPPTGGTTNAEPPTPTKPSATGAKPGGTSSAAVATPFRLAAYAVDKPADTATAPTATSGTTGAASAAPKPAEENKAAEQKKPAEEKKSAEEPKSSAASAASKPAEATKHDDSKKSGDEKKPAADKTTETKPSGEADKKAAVKKETKPIKTARQRLDDQIRKELAGKRLQENIAKIKSVLDEYRAKFADAREGEKPAPPDFAALAKEYGMTAGVTGLVSQQELSETDFGKSYVINGETRQYAPVTDLIFGSTAVFKADTSYALFGEAKNRVYVFWKTDDQAGGEPKWDQDTQNTVREEWKLVQARKLALDAAEKLKVEISKSENAANPLKSIVDAKQGIVVMEPPKFTWLTSFLGEQPTISKVGDLKSPGQDFMKKVFDLSPGQVTVATNLPQTEVYVVRLKELTPFKDLWDEFSSPEASMDYMRLLLGAVDGEVNPAWKNKVFADANFVDNRKEANKAGEKQPAPRPEAPEGPPPPEEM